VGRHTAAGVAVGRPRRALRSLSRPPLNASIVMPIGPAMDIRFGFTLDAPSITVPWDSSESDLQRLVGSRLRYVTTGYWAAPVEALGGLRCQLGFHFDKDRGLLEELEFFRASYTDPQSSFDEFQAHFERVFGKPTETADGREGFPSYRWIVSGVEISHLVRDRFGPEEHMRVRRFFRGAA
jgi:hypothetical protein